MEEHYKLLAECIRSGQLTEKQIQEELEADAAFASWYWSKYL